jgi:hypothetical protein
MRPKPLAWSTRATLALLAALAFALAAGLLVLDALLGGGVVLRVLAGLFVGVAVASLAGLGRPRQGEAGVDAAAEPAVEPLAVDDDAATGSRNRRIASSNTASS